MATDGKCAICGVVENDVNCGASGDNFVCVSCRDWNSNHDDKSRNSMIDRENWKIHDDYMLHGWR